jgi:hypothetical protein
VTFYITCIGQIHLFYPDHKPYLCDETRSQVEIPAGVSMPGFDSRRSGTTVVYTHFPNPISARGGSNPSAMTIRYSLAKPSPVRVTIYNIMGRRVRTLVDAFQDKGEHSLVWNATDDENNPSGSGVYFYRIENGETVIQKKLILVR